MIIPRRTPQGRLDVAHLGAWTAVCDHCHAPRPLGEAAASGEWIIGQRYNIVCCPTCVIAEAIELITSAKLREPDRGRLGRLFGRLFRRGGGRR